MQLQPKNVAKSNIVSRKTSYNQSGGNALTGLPLFSIFPEFFTWFTVRKDLERTRILYFASDF
jgi:hypothetical protein